MSAKKKKITPNPEVSSLSEWSDIIHRMGEESRAKEKQLRMERADWLRDYFGRGNVRDLGETRIIGWELEGIPILNSRFLSVVLASEEALNQIWHQIQSLAQFDPYLRDTLKLPQVVMDEE